MSPDCTDGRISLHTGGGGRADSSLSRALSAEKKTTKRALEGTEHHNPKRHICYGYSELRAVMDLEERFIGSFAFLDAWLMTGAITDEGGSSLDGLPQWQVRSFPGVQELASSILAAFPKYQMQDDEWWKAKKDNC